MAKGKVLRRMTVAQAQANLEAEAQRLVKEARWSAYRTKINELRRPLLELRMARQSTAREKGVK